MRRCWNWRLPAILLFYFYLCVVRGSDSDADSKRTSADTQISDLNQLTNVPDSNVATTSFENTGHSTEVPTSTKQKRCNRDRLGATLTARQNLPSDINLIPKRHDVSHIAKNLCIQCISLNKCKTAEGCRACSLLCKDVVLLKDQTKAADAPTVECANPTTARGNGGPVVENAASSEGAIDAEQKPTDPNGPILGSRARFGEEEACGGHHLATVTTGNVKEMILQMVGVQDTKDILSVSVRATTRSGTVPVAKGPEGPEALLTIFKDELTSAIEAENVVNGIQEPPTIHELFFKVLEMVQNSKSEVSHVEATHADETPPQTQHEELAEEHEGSLASQMVTGSQNSTPGTNHVGASHTERLSPLSIQEDNGEPDVHPLTRKEEENFLTNDPENSRQSDRVGSERTENVSVTHMQEGNQKVHEHTLTGRYDAQNSKSNTGKVASTDTEKSSLRQMQEEDEEVHGEDEVWAPQVKKTRLESDRLGSIHAQKSSPRQMQEEDGDMLPRFPLVEQPEGFVVPQLANPAIIEGPPPPGILLGATHKENKTSDVMDEMQNASPNNRQVEAVDSTEEDLPRYNLADHEGSLVLQVSNISTIGLSPPTGNHMDNSFIPDMEAEASEQKPVSVTGKGQSIEGRTGAEAKGKQDFTISGTAAGDDIKMEAKSLAKQAFNSVDNVNESGTILGMMPDTESEGSSNKSSSQMSTIQDVGAATSESEAFGINKSTSLPKSAIETPKAEHDLVANTKHESSAIETPDKTAQSGGVLGSLPGFESTDMQNESLGTAGASMLGNKIKESTPLDTTGAVSGNEVDESSVQTLRPNQVVYSSKSTDILEGSTIKTVGKSDLHESTLGSMSELKSHNSKMEFPGIVTMRNEFEEVAPLGIILESEDNSIVSSMEGKTLEDKPMSKNEAEATSAVIDHEASRKTSFDAVQENSSAILGVDLIPNEEAKALGKEPMDNIEGIVTPETQSNESTVHIKSSLAGTVTSAVHRNGWNDPVESFQHADETQSEVPLSNSGPNPNNLKSGQSSSSETVEEVVLVSEAVPGNGITAAKEPSLGIIAEASLPLHPNVPTGKVLPEFMVATAFGNKMEAENLEKVGVSSSETILGSLLEDGVPAIASHTESSDKDSLSTFKGISGQRTRSETVVKANLGNEAFHSLIPGIVNEASESVGATVALAKTDTQIESELLEKNLDKSSEAAMLENSFEGLSINQVEEDSKNMSFDNTAGSYGGTTPTEMYVSTPLGIRSEVPTSGIETVVAESKPAQFSPIASNGAMVENNFGDSTNAKQISGTLDVKTLSGVKKSFGGLPLSDTETVVRTALEEGSSTTNQFASGASKVEPSWIQDSTNAHTEANSLEKQSGKLPGSSSANNVVAAELGGRNDMVAAASENRVMNFVVPDEFLGWSKPSDNPTTINIVIPPKPVPQESANIEKEDLREAEPQDEPRGRDEFAELETIDGDEEKDNGEDFNGDFGAENRVKESNDEQNIETDMDNRNGEFDENSEMEFQFRDTEDGAPEEEGEMVEDHAPNNIDEDENEEEAPDVRQDDTDHNDEEERGHTLKENEDSDGDMDRKTSLGIKQPGSFSRLKKLMHSMQSPQERIASMLKKNKDRSSVGAESPSLTEEGDATFPKKFARTESKIGKMLEKFRDRLHKSKAEEGTSATSSLARKNFANQDSNTFKNPNNSDTFREENSDLENDGRLSNTAENQKLGRDSLLEENIDPGIREQSQDSTTKTPDTHHLNQKVVHTTYKSSDSKSTSGNSVTLGNGRLSSDSQLKAPEDRIPADSPRTTKPQSDRQRIFKDSQDLSQLQGRMNVVNDSPLDFTPGEGLALQEPDRELALSGVNQNDPLPTPRSTIFEEHFSSTPSLSEIISSAKDKFRKTFEESTRTLGSKAEEGLTGTTLNKNSLPIVGSATEGNSFLTTVKTNPGFQEVPRFDKLLGDSTSTSEITRSNIPSSLTGGTNSVDVGNISPGSGPPFQQGPRQVLGDSISDGERSMNRIQNSGLGSIDEASVGHTIGEIGRSTGQVTQEAFNILGDTIRNSKQNIDKIFGSINDVASRSNSQQVFGENLGNSDHATLGNKLPSAGIADTTLSQSFDRQTIGDLDGIEKNAGDTTPMKSALDKIGIPRANLNRFGQINFDTSNQEGVTGEGLTPTVTLEPSNKMGKLNLGKFGNIEFPVTLQPFNRIEEAHLRQPTEWSSDYTGLTSPITVNPLKKIVSSANLKPIVVSETDVKDPTNVDDLRLLGNPQSELIVEPPGLDTSDSSEELKADQTRFPKQQGDGTVKQNQPAVTEGHPDVRKFDVHTPFSIARNMVNKPTANPISNFEAAKNALLKLQQLTGRLRKKDGTGKKDTSTNEDQPSVTDVVKVLQEISKEVISTAENVSKSKAKNVQPSGPNIVGSQVLENSWENLQPFLPRDSHPLTITKPALPHQHHVVGMTPSTTLRTPLRASGATPLIQKLLDRTSTYYTTPSAAKIDLTAMPPKINPLGNSRPSSTLPSLIDEKIQKQNQIYKAQQIRLPMKSSGTTGNGLIQLPSGFANDGTNRVGAVQSNDEATKPTSFGFDRKLPQSINNMLTSRPDAVASPTKYSITVSEGLTKLPLSLQSGAMKTNYETVEPPSVGSDKPVQLQSISDLSSSTMSSSSSDRVESMQPATKNIEEKMNSQAEDLSSPVLAARHQNSIAMSAEVPRDIYFVGTGMKLPLQMVKKEGGEVHLSVDIDKLCSCKNNSSCTNNQSIGGSELKKDLVVGESSSNILAVDGPALGVEKPASDGLAKRNIPTHRSLRDVEDRYAVEWEIEEPEEALSDVHLSTGDTRGEHRIEIEIDDPVIIPKISSSHTEETSKIKIVNRFAAATDDVKLKDITLTVGSPQMAEHVTATSENTSNKISEAERNDIKISEIVSSTQVSQIAVGSPEMPQDENDDTSETYKVGELTLKSLSPYGSDDKKSTDESNRTQLNAKKAETYQYNNPFRRVNHQDFSSKSHLDTIESVASTTEKSTYLSNLLKKLRSRLPTQEPRTVNSNLRSSFVSNLFSQRTINQEVESGEEPKPPKLSNRLKEHDVDRYNNLALKNRLFPTLGRQKKPLAKLEKTANDEKEALSIGDENKEKQGTGIMRNFLSWFKNLNNKQKR